jgi:hypothetical protein
MHSTLIFCYIINPCTGYTTHHGFLISSIKSTGTGTKAMKTVLNSYGSYSCKLSSQQWRGTNFSRRDIFVRMRLRQSRRPLGWSGGWEKGNRLSDRLFGKLGWSRLETQFVTTSIFSAMSRER